MGCCRLVWNSQALTTASSLIIFYRLYPTEVAPLRYRHLGNAAAAFGSWTFSFVTVFGGGIAIQNVGWKIWIWPVLSCAVAVITVYFMCPEVCHYPMEACVLIVSDMEA